MNKKIFYLLILSFTITSCAQREFDVFFDADSKTVTHHTDCGTIELEVSQSYDQNIYLEAKCNVQDTLTFNKDSIKILYQNNIVPICEIFSSEISKEKWFGFKEIDGQTTNFKRGDIMEIRIGCVVEDIVFHYLDTIQIFTKGAFYYKDRPIEIEKINVIVKRTAIRLPSSFSEIPEDVLCNIEKMGNDDSEVINKYEADYLNFIFREKRDDFDFWGKKMGFILSYSKKNKKHYFQEEWGRYRSPDDFDSTFGQLFIFNEVQKEECGYDAAIVEFWGKFVKTPDEVVSILKSKSR